MVSSTAEVSTLRDDIGLRFDAIDLEANRLGYVGFRVSPHIEAPRKRGRFTKRTLSQIMKSPDTRRTAAGGFNRITQHFSSDSYEIEHRGLEGELFIEDEAEWAEMIDSEDMIIEATRDGVLQGHEQDVMDIITGTAADVTVLEANQWNDPTALVANHFSIWKEKVRRQCGVRPNTLLVDAAVVDQLMQNDSVLEKAGKMSGGSVRDLLELHDAERTLRLSALAIALGLTEIIEADAIKNVGVDGPDADADLMPMFPIDRAVLFRKETANTTRRAQWLRTIHWSAAGSRIGAAFDEYNEPQTLARILRHRLDYKVKVVNPECAYILEDVIDPTIFTA